MRALIEEYGEYIYHLAYLYVKDKQLAEEITQDVFYTYSVKKDQFRGEASIKTYLTRIVINRSHDELRKLKRRKVLQAVLPFKSNERSAEQEVMKKYQGTSLKEIVWGLPIHYREIIILHYYEDFSVKEITELLRISENTVRTRLRRGRELLKQELTEEAGGLIDGYI